MQWIFKMGYLTGTTIELIAKLTPTGRRKLISNNNTLITTFGLGDSDSYYGTYTGLTIGQVPGMGGDNNGIDINNGGVGYTMRSLLVASPSSTLKPVDPSSISITTMFKHLGYKSIDYSGGSISQNIIDLADISTDSLTNLFHSFDLPITSNDFNMLTGNTVNTGGYSNTAYSGFGQTKALVIGIGNNEYSEVIDGKSIKLDISNTANTFNVYSTYERSTRSENLLDSDIKEMSSNINMFGPNRALLFSDGVVRPNGGDATKSWSTGYATNKPYSINGKERYNFTTNTNLSLTADTPVGIAYLDKGFLVITEPTIVNEFDVTDASATGTSINFDHARTSISQSITCLAKRGEFGVTTNKTWSNGDIPRITELGVFDNSNSLIAIAKLNETYYKSIDDMVAFNVKIEY